MRRNIAIIVLIALVVFLLLRNCKGGRKSIPTVKTDTVFVKIEQDTQYVPKPDTIYYTKTSYKSVPYRIFDTLYLEQLIDADTANILKDYFATAVYHDTIKNPYGYVLVKDTITQNRIKSRGVSQNLLIPEITRTITIQQPKKAQLYLGAGIWGNEADPLNGYEVNLSLKTKSDRIIGVGYQQMFNGGHFYKIEYRHKLSFRKQN
jgi:hypothetical protein